MIIDFVKNLFTPEPKVPDYYMKIVRYEYKHVPEEYVENFFKTQKRLPTMEELKDVA